MGDADSPPPRVVRPGTAWLVAALGGVVLVAGIATLWLLPPAGDEASVAPRATPSATTAEVRPTPEPAPTPPATDARFPANTTAYDVWELPQVNVFAVIPQLPVDDDPFTAPLPVDAVPLGIGAPVWADPAGERMSRSPPSTTTTSGPGRCRTGACRSTLRRSPSSRNCPREPPS